MACLYIQIYTEPTRTTYKVRRVKMSEFKLCKTKGTKQEKAGIVFLDVWFQPPRSHVAPNTQHGSNIGKKALTHHRHEFAPQSP
jgi:hypothetical protein